MPNQSYLLITNLYPPQELGGYGRCMSDFAWGLAKLGNEIEVLCADAPYLGESVNGENNEIVHRILKLKGDFRKGVNQITDLELINQIDNLNIDIINMLLKRREWDGILIGNIDLIGDSIINFLVNTNIPIIHHLGFIQPPYDNKKFPNKSNYEIAPASFAVKQSLIHYGFPVYNSEVIYPGAKIEIFENQSKNNMLPYPLNNNNPGTKDRVGSTVNPLRLCFAGLLMSSKGAHTFLEACISLNNMSINLLAIISGSTFDENYKEFIQNKIKAEGMSNNIFLTGNLNRKQLARMYSLNHIGVFPSIYPEAFGIVGAEMQASGIVLFSTGVGGSKELIEEMKSGIIFEPNNHEQLTSKILNLIKYPELMANIAKTGQEQVKEKFSVLNSSKQLERKFRDLKSNSL